jgi:hypothetical protein
VETQKNRINGYTYQYSLDIEREIAKNLLLDMQYLGTFGHHLPAPDPQSINQVPTALLGPGDLQSSGRSLSSPMCRSWDRISEDPTTMGSIWASTRDIRLACCSKLGSEQEFDRRGILGCFLENHEFGVKGGAKVSHCGGVKGNH